MMRRQAESGALPPARKGRCGFTRRALLSAAAATPVLGLAGCWGDTHVESQPADSDPVADQLRYYIGIPAAIDPYGVSEEFGLQVAFQLFDPLMRYDFAASQLKGLAASSFEVSDDARTFTFTLSSATFHNGDPVTSTDFKRAWERLVNPPQELKKAHGSSPSAYLLSLVRGYRELLAGSASELAGVTCPDDRTLKVELTAPYADFPYVCAHPALAPVPAAALEDPGSFYTKPIGNGPFYLVDAWKEGHNISLLRYDSYYRAGASIDGVLFSVLDSGDTAVKRFEADALDVSRFYPVQANAAVDSYGQSDDGDTVSEGQGVLLGAEMSVYYLACNVKADPLASATVRRAISLLIDRKSICDALYAGTMLPADSIVPPGVAGRPDEGWEYAKHDPDKASELLDTVAKMSAGSRGIKVSLGFSSSGGHEKVMDAIVQSLLKAGIEVTEEKSDLSKLEEDSTRARLNLVRLDWTPDTPTLDAALYPLFHSGSAQNAGGYEHAEVDAALDEARSLADDQARLARCLDALNIVADDMPVIPLMYYTHRLVAAKRVTRLYVDPQGFAHLAEAEIDL